jgi:adenylate cyclase
MTTGICYCAIFFLIAITVSFFGAKHMQPLNPDKTFMSLMIFNLTNKTIIIQFLFWGFMVLITLFLLQVNDKFGPGILWRFIKGDFHSPKQVDRIFMFLDMKSSTTIAENLGNEKYFQLLSQSFSDMTPAIIKSDGEIYQYVGDEIVISWSMEKGIKNHNCINCFFRIQDTLNKLFPDYSKIFGLSPKFKAGLHFGTVTAGEVGQIKRDIVYSGDALNTTSRIQDQCNKLDASLLASDDILKVLGNSTEYNVIPMGKVELKGKQVKVGLNSIQKR